MNEVVKVNTENDDFSTVFEILSPTELNADSALEDNIDKILSELQDKKNSISADIDALTNHADWLDYTVAVASGVITGLIDVFLVGEIDIKGATEKVDKQVADKVKKQVLKEKINQKIKAAKEGAKKKGRILTDKEIEDIKKRVTENFFKDPNNLGEQGGDPVLEKAIRYLENKNPVLQDNLWKGTGSSASNHHLDDIAHHPTFSGLIASILIQYFRVATFVNKKGKISFRIVSTDIKDLISNWLPIIFTGLLNWIVSIAEKQNNEERHTDIPKPVFVLAHFIASAPAAIKVIKIANTWCLHLYSDVAGSQSSAKKGNRGAGIPGLFISFMKELSSVPPLNMTRLPKFVDYLYETQKVDLRKEIAIFEELGKQAIPVVMNELLVRSFYFIRHLVIEYNTHDGWKDLDWMNVCPFGNRTVERMMTIASGTFTAIDLAGATVEGLKDAAKTPGETYVKIAAFAKGFILNVNFVGIGRLAVSVGVDIGMGAKRSKLLKERIAVSQEMIKLSNAKIQYREAKMWTSAQSTEESIQKMYENAEKGSIILNDLINQYQSDMKGIEAIADDIESKNRGLIDDLFGGIK